MQCVSPGHYNGHDIPCGRCFSCLYNKQRIWTGRIILQTMITPSVVCLTLTYDDKNLPVVGDNKLGYVQSLNKRDYQLFLKRLRERINNKIKYYISGEYGEKTGRPHFHAIIWNLDDADTIQREYLYEIKKLGKVRYPKIANTLLESWQKGNIHVAAFSSAFAAYAAKHITKQNLYSKECNHPYFVKEFSRMSLRPAIGVTEDPNDNPIIQWIYSKQGVDFISGNFDVPNVFRYDGQLYPFGRYLRNKMRLAAGMKPEQPNEVKLNEALRILELSRVERALEREKKRNKGIISNKRAERTLKRHLRR